MAGKHQSTDASHLRTLITSGVDANDMAKTFGVHITAIHRWLKEGVAPYWTLAASKVLDKAGGDSFNVLVVGVIDKEKWAIAEGAFTALGFQKVGQRNLQ